MRAAGALTPSRADGGGHVERGMGRDLTDQAMRRGIGPDAGEASRPGGHEVGDRRQRRGRGRRRMLDGESEPADPLVGTDRPELRQPREVAADVAEERDGDRRRDRQARASMEHPADEEPADPPVAVGEGVDRLELGVDERRGRDRVVAGAVRVLDQIAHQDADAVVGCGDMSGAVRRGSAHPPEAVPP